jgi:hypothetical protein
MTHLERERLYQDAMQAAGNVSTLDLRKVRAWLLDVVQGEHTQYMEVAVLLGEVVHAELKRREEGRRFLKRAPQTVISYRDWLCRFPDLAPPPDLADPARERRNVPTGINQPEDLTFGGVFLFVFVLLAVGMCLVMILLGAYGAG